MGLIREEYYSESELYLATKVFRTLAHPLRLRIIAALLVHETRTVGELTNQFPGSQSCVSDQMTVLKGHDLVIGTQINNSIQYSLNKPKWDEFKVILTTLADDEQMKTLYDS